MGYRKITNLYKDQTILLFKECYACEKIHGTSAHVTVTRSDTIFFSGGAKYEAFVSLFKGFDFKKIQKEIESRDLFGISFFGEAYGGKMQGMSSTYGKELKFVVFDVKIVHLDGKEHWVNVPVAEKISKEFGFDFVPYERIPATQEEIDKQRDRPSVQAERNGMGADCLREGVVLRPLFESYINGNRVILKHKRAEFDERTKQPKTFDPEKDRAVKEAELIAEDWVTTMRLSHIINGREELLDMKNTGDICRGMIQDIKDESVGEIEWSKAVEKAIAKKTAALFRKLVMDNTKK